METTGYGQKSSGFQRGWGRGIPSRQPPRWSPGFPRMLLTLRLGWYWLYKFSICRQAWIFKGKNCVVYYLEKLMTFDWHGLARPDYFREWYTVHSLKKSGRVRPCRDFFREWTKQFFSWRSPSAWQGLLQGMYSWDVVHSLKKSGRAINYSGNETLFFP